MKCRSCGAEIVWIRMLSGKKMPCNAELLRYFAGEDEDGHFCSFITPSGTVEHGVPDRYGDRIGYMSHFATCPNADRHRRRGK